jgi:diguanylate cyclase (GGDEF)-like protein
MSNVQWLLAVILVQHLVFGVLWLGAAYVRLARQPSAHWALMALAVAPGMSLLMLRGEVPVWLSVGAGNLLMLVAMLALRRGVQRFCRIAPTDGEHVLLLTLGLCAALVAALHGPAVFLAVLLAGGAMAWTLLRAASEIRRGLSQEFGPRAAMWCAVPLVLLAGMFLLRLAIAIVLPERLSTYLTEPGGGRVAPAFGAMVLSLLLQLNLLLLVTLRLVRRLQHQSDHDMLTGLLSRRPMAERLEAELQRQQRQGGSFALLSIDIDHFKRINDAHGHAAGDAVLQRVAQALQDNARRIDSVARMGGEEFCVLLPGADRDSAERAAARLLQAVRRLEHPELGAGRGVSISIGLAVTEQPGEPLHGLQRRLDQALYQAKSAGRDRLQHAESYTPGTPVLA